MPVTPCDNQYSRWRPWEVEKVACTVRKRSGWFTQSQDLDQVFENKGAMMGSSNPLPHGQAWADDALPNEPAKEDRQQRACFSEHGWLLFSDYTKYKMAWEERLVLEDRNWLVVVPFWAEWPFETPLLPRRRVGRLPDPTHAERDSLARVLKRLLIRYENLFKSCFPYSTGWHGAPFDAQNDDAFWQLHVHFFPLLLRSTAVKQFMVGYELLAEAQRDLTAEQAAFRFGSLYEKNYRSFRQ